MRLGFVLYGELSTRTGGFLYDRMLIHNLEELGAEVEVIQIPWRSYPVSLLLTPLAKDGKRFPISNFDLLIEDELSHPSLINMNRSIRRRSDLPIISLVHHLRSSEDHPAPLNLLYRRVEKAYLSTVDGVIANSPHTLKSVRLLLDRRIPAIVAPPGRGHYETHITELEIDQRAHLEGPLNILFLGSIIPRKRLDDLIDALASIRNIDFELTIIGRDTSAQRYTREMKGLIQSHGFQEHVHWLGEQTDDRLKQTLKASHLLVVPSSHEGFGIAYLDAMGYGVVPIGTRAGGASSLIENTQNGYLIQPGDSEQLARYIQTLADDRDLLGRLAINAFQRYQEHPTWKEVTGTVNEYLKTFVIGTNQTD